MNLSTATPVEIDTAIAAIYVRWYAQNRVVTQQVRYLEDVEKTLAAVDAGTYRYAWQEKYDRPKYERMLAERTERVETEQAKAADIMRETLPYNEEYRRRGGWTRFYLVDNKGGHVHSSMACGTCFPTTEFVWLPEFSGRTEAECVEAAGEQACTVCFPSAPVDVLKRKSSIESPARREARIEREAKRAATAARKAAKALFEDDPDRFIDTGRSAYGDRISTIAAAKSFLTNGYGWNDWTHPSYTPEARDEVAQALATRTGETVEDVLTAAAKRAARRGY